MQQSNYIITKVFSEHMICSPSFHHQMYMTDFFFFFFSNDQFVVSESIYYKYTDPSKYINKK